MRLAAVVYDSGSGQDVDALLAGLACGLKGQGWRLAGAVQANVPRADGCRCDMTFEDLASGRRISASEERGPLATGCRLDTYALEDAVGHALSSLTPSIDLVIINRFGKREAEGKGFRPVIEAAVLQNTPVIVGLSVCQLENWTKFTGDDPVLLQPIRAAAEDWCASVVALGLQRLDRSAVDLTN